MGPHREAIGASGRTRWEAIMADKTKTVLADGAQVALALDGAKLTLNMARRDDGTARFSSGSAGYHAQGKAEGADGRRYQVNITAVLIGSKATA